VVGGGPAGLEAAVSLGKRGYDVAVAEARRVLGGRVTGESSLPGLAQWSRVRDWRLNQIDKLTNVTVYLESSIDEEQILAFDPDRLVVATGARWRKDGRGRWHSSPVPGWDSPWVHTPDDVMAGVLPEGPVVVFDDDHYYLGGVIAELLRRADREVTLVTPANEVSTWTTRTDEQHRIQTRILELGIRVETGMTLSRIDAGSVTLESVHTSATWEVEAAHLVMVTSREPVDQLFHTLRDRFTVHRIGDCLAPGTIASAVHSGHRYAREVDAETSSPVAFSRE
jgi:dimethylamine/trimethylamine dehydrogenase